MEELEDLFNANNMWGYYQAVAKIIEPKLNVMAASGTQGGILIQGEDGAPDKLVTGSEEILLTWKNYFSQLLNQDSLIGENVEGSLRSQMEVQLDRDHSFTIDELELGLKQMTTQRQQVSVEYLLNQYCGVPMKAVGILY